VREPSRFKRAVHQLQRIDRRFQRGAPRLHDLFGASSSARMTYSSAVGGS
jgi:hypothetical protein